MQKYPRDPISNPGDALMVWALCVHEGRLYAGTFETGKDQVGHVYRFENGAPQDRPGAAGGTALRGQRQ